ncbi:MAG: TauD/TfdA family dioxygenase, partial [Planctomycetes bacterium]|nr:TauD/TfdA family dioxygenase [Planctomycetota bacterium]
MRIRPLSGALGAEVSGVDLAVLNDATFADIREAFLAHLVLVFPEQRITPAQQIAFTARFGPVETHPLRTRGTVKGHPEVLVLENSKRRRGLRNDFWHSDISYAVEPPLGSALYALEVPEGCGDTMFCNMYAAHE